MPLLIHVYSLFSDGMQCTVGSKSKVTTGCSVLTAPNAGIIILSLISFFRESRPILYITVYNCPLLCLSFPVSNIILCLGGKEVKTYVETTSMLLRPGVND